MVGQNDTARQVGASKFIMFDAFEGMNTQAARQGLDKKQFPWLENMEPIAPNKLAAVLGPMPPLTSLPGEIIVKMYFAAFGGVLWQICFCASGSGYGVNLITGNPTKFAPAGTFSSAPDCAQYANQRLLIFDTGAGYSTWDGTVFVMQGGVSPNLPVTAGGSGYGAGASATISGGSGHGAVVSVQVVAGVVVGLVLISPGTGYLASDTLTVTISPVFGGSGATANAHVWPFVSPAPSTGCVAFGRVWMAAGRVIIVTGTGSATYGQGYDDFSSADASLTTTLADSDLAVGITALRFLNNYLYIIGDNSVKSIGSISVSGSVTSFSIVTLTSDQGTLFQSTVLSFNRLVVFANAVGVWAVFGASVEKISGQMDGVFKLMDMSQPLCAAVNDLHSANHAYLLLARYKDPVRGTRSVILTYTNRRWFICSQGDNLRVIATALLVNSGLAQGISQTFGSSGTDVTQLLENPLVPVSWQVITALVDDQDPIFDKRCIRGGVGQTVEGASVLAMTLDSETGSQPISIQGSVSLLWTTLGLPVTWTTHGLPVTWAGTGFIFDYDGTKNNSGHYLGATLSGTNIGQIINVIALEYQRAQAWG